MTFSRVNLHVVSNSGHFNRGFATSMMCPKCRPKRAAQESSHWSISCAIVPCHVLTWKPNLPVGDMDRRWRSASFVAKFNGSAGCRTVQHSNTARLEKEMWLY